MSRVLPMRRARAVAATYSELGLSVALSRRTKLRESAASLIVIRHFLMRYMLATARIYVRSRGFHAESLSMPVL